MAEDQEKPRTSRRAERRAEPEVDAEERDQAADSEREVEAQPAQAPLNRRQRRAAQATASSDDPKARNARLRDASRQRRMERSKERQAAVTRGLDASERVDDALSRGTQAVSSFLRRHFNVVQWLIVLGVVGGVGYQVYSWRQQKSVEHASDELMAAVAADTGRVGEAPADGMAEFDRTKTFPTPEARAKAAGAAYQKVMDARGEQPLGMLAKLGLAGVRYDEGKFADAATLYRQVADSKLAAKDSDVKHRALEGVGMSLEGKGDSEGALKAFKQLGNSEIKGFAALGAYHQARVALAKGDKEGSKKLIEQAKQKLGKITDPEAEQFAYLRGALQELEVAIDPSAAASATSLSPAQLEALQKGMGTDPSRLNELLRQMGLDPTQLGGAPAPGAPAPAPAPEPAPPAAPEPAPPAAPEPAPEPAPAP